MEMLIAPAVMLVIGIVYIVCEYCIKPGKALHDGLIDWASESYDDL